MSRGHTLVCVCALAGGAGEASADAPRRVEAGVFVGLDRFGDDIELGNAWAPEQIPGTAVLFGLRAGLVFLPDLAPGAEVDPSLGVELEGKLALASTGAQAGGGRASYAARVFGWRAHLIGSVNLGARLRPHLTVGFGGETISTSSPYMVDDTDAQFQWGPGASVELAGGWAARIDVRHGLTAGRTSIMVSTLELHAGASYRWGGGGAAKVAPRPPEPEPEPDREPEPEPEPEPVKPPDVDADGLPDTADTCPDLPEDPDGFQDGDGCPDTDNDGDTILDAVDACVDQLETFNGFADEDGCPDELPAALKDFTGAVEGITFDNAKARLRPSSRATLDQAAATLREFASVRVRIEGHTDAKGGRAKNVLLSQKRADAVKWYLIDKGIAADRIETIGHGPDVPRDPKKPARNNRIELYILFDDPTTAVPAPAPPPAPSPAPAPLE